MKLLCSKKELSINMKEQEKKYPSKTEIKNLRVLKIIFPIVVTTVVALFVPSAVPLIDMLMFGNLVKEIGSNTFRLFDAASNSIMNACHYLLRIISGCYNDYRSFPELDNNRYRYRWFPAFALSITGWYFVCETGESLFKKKINPLIGATWIECCSRQAVWRMRLL